MTDEFYIGWQARAPAGLAKRVGLVAGLLLLAAPLIAWLVASSQAPFAASTFEFGTVREFRGILEEHPHPSLRVPRPGSPPGWSRYLLVGPGKHGAGALVEGLDGRPVRLSGTLLNADGRTAIELVPGSARELEGAGAAPARESLGQVTLRGEIADSKCHLGVMNPGRHKVHRACAINCLRGGIPPVLLVDRRQGAPVRMAEAEVLLLVGAEGEPLNEAVLPLVAVPVEVTGELWREDDLFVLRAAPGDIVRLD